MILPKSYLSYSAASLWYRSKSAFRSRYYLNAPSTSSPQTELGKELADLIKDNPNHPSIAHIPKLPIRDEGFTVDISGVPVLMYPDSLSLDGVPSFYEYKSGVEPWTQEKVDAHMQLKLYSLGIKEKYGAVQDVCTLFWLVTRMVDAVDSVRINGKQYDVVIGLPELTGEIITFETVVTEVERFRARQWIIQAAHEIQSDFIRYQKQHASTT